MKPLASVLLQGEPASGEQAEFELKYAYEMGAKLVTVFVLEAWIEPVSGLVLEVRRDRES